MNAFDKAEGRILIALFIAHHAQRRQILTWKDLEATYHTNVNKMHFEAIVAELEGRGVVKVFRDKDGSGIVLLDQGVRYAHERILAFLGADTFDVNWKTERILTDGSEQLDVPCPNGWVLMQVAKAKEEPSPPSDLRPSDVAIPTSGDASLGDAPDDVFPNPTINRRLNSESGWVKWQTILTAVGVAVAIVAILLTT